VFSTSVSTALVPVATSYLETVSFAFFNSSFEVFASCSSLFTRPEKEVLTYASPHKLMIVAKQKNRSHYLQATVFFVFYFIVIYIVDAIHIVHKISYNHTIS